MYIIFDTETTGLPKRWNFILDTMIAAGAEHNLSEEFITKILKAIHEESISHQHKIISE